MAKDGAEAEDDLSIVQECEREISVNHLSEILRFTVVSTQEDDSLRLPRDVSSIERLYFNNMDISSHRVKPSEIQFGV